MKLGFIGCGNMAKAMLGGILKNEICAKEDVIATAKSEASRENARNTYGIQVTAVNIEAAKSADVLVLAVKPIFYEEVIHEIKDAVDEKKIIIYKSGSISDTDLVSGSRHQYACSYRKCSYICETGQNLRQHHIEENGMAENKRRLLFL